jgi:secreted trypsin-like serine protease
VVRVRALLATAVAILALPASAPAAVPRDDAPSIIGGSPVAAGGFPFAASVSARLSDTLVQSCTGSVIAANAVLTASHCVYNASGGNVPLIPSAFTVTLESLHSRPPDADAEVRHVVAIHAYSPATDVFNGDAAVLILDGTTTAPAVRLATPADAALYAPGTPTAVAGWGQTSTAGDRTTTLMQGAQTVQPNSACLEAYASFSPAVQLCSGGPGNRPAACHGDSGGPLVASTPSGFVLIGITSFFGNNCGDSPDFFVRVSTMSAWIVSQVAGAAPAPLYTPAYAPPATVSAQLQGDGLVVSFAAPLADAATTVTGYGVSLARDGLEAATASLAVDATSASFPTLKPGAYTATVTAAYAGGGASPPAASAPITLAPPHNTRRPRISGAPQVGSNLTCNKGTWAWPGVTTFRYRWLRGSARIARATGQHHRAVKADAGHHLACVVTLVTASGTSTHATSAAALVPLPLLASKAPRIVGRLAVGARLACAGGTWKHSGALHLTYRWLRNGRPVAHGAAARYTVVAADAGKRLSCRVTAAAGGRRASTTTAAVVVP